MISLAWVAHLPPEKREDFKNLVLGETRNPVLIRLADILEEKRVSLETSERSPKVYENPNWAYLQAHTNGMRQAISLIEDLLKFIKE